MRTKMRQLRVEWGFTMKYLAKELGISLSHYSQVEVGDKQPSLNLALRIKRVLNCNDDSIFDNEPLARK